MPHAALITHFSRARLSLVRFVWVLTPRSICICECICSCCRTRIRIVSEIYDLWLLSCFAASLDSSSKFVTLSFVVGLIARASRNSSRCDVLVSWWCCHSTPLPLVVSLPILMKCRTLMRAKLHLIATHSLSLLISVRISVDLVLGNGIKLG